ncbi:MAG: PEGA domain-containing protein, partial [Vicinamibacterales bacterium]
DDFTEEADVAPVTRAALAGADAAGDELPDVAHVPSAGDDDIVTSGEDAYMAEGPSPARLPRAVLWIAALLVAFAAGYAVRGRSDPPGADAATRASTPETAETQSAAGSAYSEQTVAPRVAPPATNPAGAERPSPARPAAAANGRLIVRSTPPGAAVTLDGRQRGRTPLVVEQLALRSHVVSVAQSGFAPARQEVTLTSGAPSRTLTFRLQRRPGVAAVREPREAPAALGSLYIDSRPRGARVFVDGNPVGVTPLRVPDLTSGSHVVRLELADHRPWTINARVRAGEQARVSGSLELIR